MNAFSVHGHFYQPPREDPITEQIPHEPGAGPFLNWNERIHSHCYAPNAELGNFERISFDLGPTLAGWIQRHHPDTLQKIVMQDRSNEARFGVGNAMAQAYHHTILPLAKREDKITQIRWGIADFVHIFGHRPAGMWLPEAAVDLETMSILAENGIEHIVLAPWQAAQPIDSTHPYWVYLPGGRKMAVFFYDQDLSMRVSFDPPATTDAGRFISELLLPRYRRHRTADLSPQFILIASDGELYGHHQIYRDKFLAHLTHSALTDHGLQPSFPGMWLLQNPPQFSTSISNGTSWSCHHGVSRWKGTCPCTPYGEWKTSLRNALNTIGDALDFIYLTNTEKVIPDPFELRNRYMEVRLGQASVADLVYDLAGETPAQEQLDKLTLLLQSQFERQRMFTSCGFYFEDFDRIEPRNLITYAAQAVWLTKRATGDDLTTMALQELSHVRSWRTGLCGDDLFARRMIRLSCYPECVQQNESTNPVCTD